MRGQGTAVTLTQSVASLGLTLPPSYISRPNGQVAQLVEQRTENPRVGGSIPSLATRVKQRTLQIRSLVVASPRLAFRCLERHPAGPDCWPLGRRSSSPWSPRAARARERRPSRCLKVSSDTRSFRRPGASRPGPGNSGLIATRGSCSPIPQARSSARWPSSWPPPSGLRPDSRCRSLRYRRPTTRPMPYRSDSHYTRPPASRRATAWLSPSGVRSSRLRRRPGYSTGFKRSGSSSRRSWNVGSARLVYGGEASRR